MIQLKQLLVLCVFFFSYGKVAAQLVEGTPCTATCLDPTKSVITGRQPNQNNVSPNLNLPCGGGTSEDNPAWWIVRPSGNSLTFSITTSNCVAGGCGLGVQMTLWEGDNCGSVTAVDCVVGTSGIFTSTVTPCRVYYLQIDGLCECQCNIILTYDKAQILKEVPAPKISGSTQICNNKIARFCATIADLKGCIPDSYKWTCESASAGTFTKIPGELECVDFKPTTPIVNGKIKIFAEPVFSGKCPPKTNKATFEVEVADLKPATCAIEICPKEQPFVYNIVDCIKTTNPSFSGIIKPNNFTVNLPGGTKMTEKINYTLDGANCAGEVTLNINVLDDKKIQLPPLLLCEKDTQIIKGQMFFGQYVKPTLVPILIKSNTPKACDSTFEMHVGSIVIFPQITGLGTLDCSAKQLTLNAAGTQSLTLPHDFSSSLYVGKGKRAYQWSKDGIDIVGATNSTLTVTSPGVYAVALSYTYEITQIINGVAVKISKMCSKSTEVTIFGASGLSVAETPFALSSEPCKYGVSTYAINPDPMAQEYSWTVTGATIITQSTDPKGKVEITVKNNGGINNICLVKKACDIVSAPSCIVESPLDSTVAPFIAGNIQACQSDSTSYFVLNKDIYSPDAKFKWAITNGIIKQYNFDSTLVYVKWSNLTGKGEITVTVTDQCGTVSTKKTVDILGLPSKVTTILGKEQVCVGDIQQYKVPPTLFAAFYYWTLSGGGVLTSNNSDSIQIKWNTPGKYTLCVTAANNCMYNGSGNYCIEITVNPSPKPNAGSNKKVCAKTTTLDATIPVAGITGKWNLLSGPGTAAFGDDNNAESSVDVTKCGTYKFTWTESNGTCSSPDTVEIRFSEPPKVKSLVYTCNNGSFPKTYDVFIVMEGCDGPFTPTSKYPATVNASGTVISILGVPQTDNNWTLIVSNAINCVSTVKVVADCNCDTRAGTMKIEPLITGCDISGKIKAKHNGDDVNDGNDVSIFVLHEDSSTLGINAIAESKTGEFEFDPLTMNCDKIYYISYVIGNNKNGKPDPQDKCLQVTPQGQPVRWNCQAIQAAATCNSPACKGTTVNFLALGGKNYKWSGPDGFKSTLQNPILANVEAKNAGTYTVTVSDGTNCTNTASTILVVENCIATKDILAKAAIQLFPNPVKEQLTIQSNSPIFKVVLSNSIGQEVLSQKVDNETITLKMENLPIGIYFAKVYLDEKTFEVYSVVKE